MFASHLAVPGTGAGEVTLWALCLLTIGLLFAGFQAALSLIAERVRAKRSGKPFFDERTVKWTLLVALAIGLAFRVTTWGPGGQTTLGWVGTGLIGASFIVFVVLSARKEVRSRDQARSFYFSPLWKYGLLCICIVTLLIQGATTPSGAASSVNVTLFSISLVALIAQTVGRWSRRHKSASLK
jgi:cytochrome c oxidase assembly factor CtaG